MDTDYKEKLNLEWQNPNSKNRIQSLIEYFKQCILKNKDNQVILEHINNIFAYEENLKQLFNGGSTKIYGAEFIFDMDISKDNGLTVKVFAIAMELLTSKNIYKSEYIKNEEGLSQLKEVLEKIYICKRRCLGADFTAIKEELPLFMSDIFDISNKSKRHKIEDFFKEYDRLLKWDITMLEYTSSLISFNPPKDIKENPNFPFYSKHGSIFDIEIKDDNKEVAKKIDYTKMYDEEKFDFIMNFIMASYKIELSTYIFGPRNSNPFCITSPICPYTRFGHQFKYNELILSDIENIFVIEKNYQKTGYPFNRDSLIPIANYVLYVSAKDNKKYPLYSILCQINQESISMPYTSYVSNISDYGLNLTLEQMLKILDLIQNKIFDEKGLLNFNISNNHIEFITCITMFESLNESLKGIDNRYKIIKNEIEKLKDKIYFAGINYFAKMERPQYTEFKSHEEKILLNSIMKRSEYDYKRIHDPFVRGIIDERTNTFLGQESREICGVLRLKYEALNKTRDAAFEEYKRIFTNLNNFSNVNGELIEKYLKLLYKLSNPYDDNQKNNEDIKRY